MAEDQFYYLMLILLVKYIPLTRQNEIPFGINVQNDGAIRHAYHEEESLSTTSHRFFSEKDLIAVFTTQKHLVNDISYMHVDIDLDMTHIDEQYNEAMKCLSEKALTQTFSQKYIQSMLEMTRNLDVRRKNALKSLPTPADLNDTYRSKRAISGLIFLTMAIGTLAFGSSAAALVVAETNRINRDIIDKNFDAVKQMIESISANATEFDLLLTERHNLFADLRKQSNDLMMNMGHYIMCQEHRNKLEHNVQLLEELVEAAHSRRMHLRALPGDKLSLVWNKIQKRAYGQGFGVGMSNVHQLFQNDCDTFFITKRDKTVLKIILHVPIYKPDSLMQLYRFWPVPLKINDQYKIVRTKERYIAITENRKMYKVLDESQLASCASNNDILFCYQNSIIYKKSQKHCLMALLNENIEEINELCVLEPYDQEMAVQISDTDFLHYTPNEVVAIIKCKNNTSYYTVYKGNHRIRLDGNCTLHTPFLRLAGFENIGSTITINNVESRIEMSRLNVKNSYHARNIHDLEEELRKLERKIRQADQEKYETLQKIKLDIKKTIDSNLTGSINGFQFKMYDFFHNISHTSILLTILFILLLVSTPMACIIKLFCNHCGYKPLVRSQSIITTKSREGGNTTEYDSDTTIKTVELGLSSDKKKKRYRPHSQPLPYHHDVPFFVVPKKEDILNANHLINYNTPSLVK
ncbi:uncharacterized protein [Lepeophtheirus salmonis]|nr:uncharacterized protein LOC121128641 [Lepeophtheirus salmonis]